ncbi:MAG: helix-turn-helix transcriptional regulator [Clostridiales bacterium]|jgi:transcriptional regulator with XRE-family HTH domain|nr:helix-turn-helix transcriptional regulator [Clostridiales bacterium]
MDQWLYQDFTIGAALKRLRKRSGLTQDQVAAQLQIMNRDVTRSMYAQMECGTYGIRMSVLVALKSIFRAEYSEFFADLP